MSPGRGMQPMMRPMLTPQMASAAQNLAAMGSGRDSLLAHINPQEARILMQMGGKGDLNPRTGLPQFDDGGGGGADAPAPVVNDPTGAIAGGSNTPTPTGQFPAGQTWASLNASIPDSGGVTGLWQDPNSGQWYNPSGALAPLDPGQAAALNTWFTNDGPTGSWDPIDTSFAGGGFIPQPGNANFQIDPSTGDYIVSPTGDKNLQSQYNTDFLFSEIAKKNDEAGGLLPLEILGGVAGVVGGVAGLADLGAFGALDAGTAATDASLAADVPSAGAGAATTAGAGAFGSADSLAALTPLASDPTGAAAVAAGDVFDTGDAGAAVAPIGTTDPFAVTSGVTSDFTGGVGDSFTAASTLGAGDAGTTALGDAGGTLGTLGGDTSGDSLFLGGTTSDTATSADSLATIPSATPDQIAAGDYWDTPVAAAPDASAPAADATTTTGAIGGGDTLAAPAGSPTGNIANAAAGGTPAATTANSGGFFQNLGSNFEKGLEDPFKLLGLGAAGFGLLHSLTGQNPQVGNVGANETALNNLATTTGQTGAQLQSYLTSGTLPPGLMQQVNQATAAAIQGVKAKYAANGMGPNSTAEQQDINTINQNVPATIATIGQQLLTAGTADLTISAGVLNNLLTANTTINNQTNAAIANLARALSGGGSNQQFTLTPTTKAA